MQLGLTSVLSKRALGMLRWQLPSRLRWRDRGDWCWQSAASELITVASPAHLSYFRHCTERAAHPHAACRSALLQVALDRRMPGAGCYS